MGFMGRGGRGAHDSSPSGLRVAIVSQAWPEDPAAHVAGSSVQSYYIARELERTGHTVLVILSQPLSIPIEGGPRLRVVSIGSGRGLRSQLFGGWISAVTEELRAFDPDIVYQRGKLPETVACGRYCRRSRATFIWASNSDNSGTRWKFVAKRLARKGSRVVLPLRLAEAAVADIMIERSLRRADLVLAQTDIQRATLARNYGLDPVLLGSGHPIPPLRRPESEIPTILWLANLTDVKRPWLFADLAVALRGVRARFVMAGDAPDRSILRRVLAIADGLPGFEYVGRVTLEEGNRLMERSDLFVLTSEYEGLPNTMIQACIHGIPTVSLANDPDGLIRKNDMGLVPATPGELAECVARLAADRTERIALGENAYAFAGRAFDIAAVTARLLELARGTSKRGTDRARSSI